MKAIYNKETDIFTFILKEGKVAESDEVKEGIIIDYYSEGHILSIGVLDALEHISEPLYFAYEIKGEELKI
ncbi:MAG: DUF2283 domain-containing protein [Spirochaetota bacterium]